MKAVVAQPIEPPNLPPGKRY